MTLDHCYLGDCRDVMRNLIAEGVRVQCIVTSPPYFGLRDYGVDGQIGLEKSLPEFVATMVEVFDLARDLLADDGTLWLNLGDSYAANRGYQVPDGKHKDVGNSMGMKAADVGLKPKDLMGVPWRVALALQEPRYLGRIKNEIDRVWLAAMIDAEGCIFIHKRKAGQHNGQGYFRQNDSYGPGLEVANTSLAVVERCAQITGLGSICSQSPEQNGRRKQTIYRWNLRTIECREIIREVYPYLVAKKQQARILIGCPSSGKEAEAAHAALIGLHRGSATDVDFKDPAPMFGPGWYLRQDVIWSKANPMPESVRDRCTKAHEYLFLMSKSERYYFDQDAILEPCSEAKPRLPGNVNPPKGQLAYEAGDERQRTKAGLLAYAEKQRKLAADGSGTKNNASFDAAMAIMPTKRNKRSVWTIATESYSEAHFATFPQALVEPCILAGSRPGDIVFDPFMGSGTTAQVAQRLGRRWLGAELNPEYIKLQAERTRQRGLELTA